MRYRYCCFFFILSHMFLFSSCRKLVTDEFSDAVKAPVINAILIAGQQFELQASYTAKINETKFTFIPDAEISLLCNGLLTEEINIKGEGLYYSPHIVMEGTIYRCELIVPGFHPIICSDTIPTTPIVYIIKHINEAGRNAEGVSYPAINISFANDTTKPQYYEICIRLILNDYETRADLERITDPLIINEGLPIALFSNELIKDTICNVTVNYTTGMYAINDGVGSTRLYPLIVELRHISHTYYMYARSIYLYNNNRYPDGLNAPNTAFNMYSNIEGGYGVFAGLAVFQSDTIYPNSY